jgi:hypothetical protein
VTSYGIELDESNTTGPVISLVSDNALVSVEYPASVPGFAKVTAIDKVTRDRYVINVSLHTAVEDPAASHQRHLSVSNEGRIHFPAYNYH